MRSSNDDDTALEVVWRGDGELASFVQENLKAASSQMPVARDRVFVNLVTSVWSATWAIRESAKAVTSVSWHRALLMRSASERLFGFGFSLVSVKVMFVISVCRSARPAHRLLQAQNLIELDFLNGS